MSPIRLVKRKKGAISAERKIYSKREQGKVLTGTSEVPCKSNPRKSERASAGRNSQEKGD